MFRKIVLLFVFLVLAAPAFAISLDFNESTVGKEKQLSGNILLPAGSYNKDSKIKLSINSDSAEKNLAEIINCTSGCSEKSSAYYVYTGATDTKIESSNFLTGIRIKKGSTISIDARFNISNADVNFPDSPEIDVNNDNLIEWKFQGKAPASIDWNVNPYLGPSVDTTGATELNLDASGTCQQIFLNKSDTFRISSTLRKSIANPPSLGVYIHGVETSLQSCSSLQSTFSQIECTISVSIPLNDGEYKVCLTAPSSGVILAVNDTVTNPNGYRCTAPSCSKVQFTDYAIQAKSSNFITTLQESLEYFESNVNKGSYFKDAIASYLQKCSYQDDYCIIPINVSAKTNNVKIHDLFYKETLSDGQIYDRNKFLLGVESKGEKPLYELSSQKSIPLQAFNLLAPKDVGNYTLKVEYGEQSAAASLKVIPAPTAKFNVSLALSPIEQPITFDASQSSGDSNLTFSWDFGDNRTAAGKVVTHAYLQVGKYSARLTVTDENNIQDSKTSQLEIFSETASDELTQNTISHLESLQQDYASSSQEIKEVFLGLGLDIELENAILQLQDSAQLTEEEVNKILNNFPTKINVIKTIKVSPYLSELQVDELYGFESESYKTTLQEVNTRFQKQVTARQVSLTYPTSSESFILVSKKITTPEPISDVVVVEVIPNTLVSSLNQSDFIESIPEITRLQDYQSAKFTIPNLQDEFSFSYKLKGSNIDAVKNTVSVVMPQELSPALIPFNCGDLICNPAEDSISCPEDCSCGNNQCDLGESKYSCQEDCKSFPWSTIIVLIILAGAGFSIWKFRIYRVLNLDDFFSTLTSSFHKSPFKSGVELAKVKLYIKSALEKGYDRGRIESSLLEKGWSKQQVDYAFSKLDNKKT